MIQWEKINPPNRTQGNRENSFFRGYNGIKPYFKEKTKSFESVQDLNHCSVVFAVNAPTPLELHPMELPTSGTIRYSARNRHFNQNETKTTTSHYNGRVLFFKA